MTYNSTTSVFTPYIVPKEDGFQLYEYKAVFKDPPRMKYSTVKPVGTPEILFPVVAKILRCDSFGSSYYWEVVYYYNGWNSFENSPTFEDGEQVVKWIYCDDLETL